VHVDRIIAVLIVEGVHRETIGSVQYILTLKNGKDNSSISKPSPPHLRARRVCGTLLPYPYLSLCQSPRNEKQRSINLHRHVYSHFSTCFAYLFCFCLYSLASTHITTRYPSSPHRLCFIVFYRPTTSLPPSIPPRQAHIPAGGGQTMRPVSPGSQTIPKLFQES